MIATDGHLMAVAWDQWGQAEEACSIEFDWTFKQLKTPAKENGLRRLIVENFDEPGHIVPYQPKGAPWGKGEPIAAMLVTENTRP